ncbi:hypothetical protein V502_00223 [Pseudogymnoascus sp. VKM F-4520 (FW-2644)]|nr:hypothetical protein V502_00223 [Pseudogymnoascus sp. VKM F-4520 (FW-2644)]
MRLLQYKSDGNFSLTEFFESDIPKYAILSHRWRADGEEVTYQDLINGSGKTKVGYKKIQFCGEQAKRSGLQYFWVDTCCIDKSNAVELQEAINSMFRWYRHAIKCYVYLPDVSQPRSDSADGSNVPWESTFRKSEWFTRGWTLQELIAPASVDFFSKEGELLGNKASLERHICEITGIPANALRGSLLSDLSVTERMIWAASRETYRQEDKAYSLLGIFDVNMPLIYGEGRDKALQRLREEIDKASMGTQRESFSVVFSLSVVRDIERFVAREAELVEIHRELGGDGSRRTVVLHGLGGIGKTQLSVAYAKRHKDSYSAIFWLNIKDEDSVKQSFAKIARQISREHPSTLRLSNVDINESLDEVVDAVKAWLSRPNNTRWLMVFDNYDNPKLPSNSDPTAVDIQKFLPESYQGSIIITTRSSQVRIGHSIQIRKLSDVHDSLEILSNVSRREGLRSDPNAIMLARELDGLPLALATAGAYLDQVAVSISDYLCLYKQSWVQLQESSPELDSYEDRTLYSTWQISFDHVKQQNDLSAKLLCFWAYFDSQDLWLELLQHSDSNDPEWVRELTKDEISFHQAVRVLSGHGLVEVDTSSQGLIESQGYSIHGCVHSWTIHVLNQAWDQGFARLAMKFIGSHIPEKQTLLPWLTQRRLLQHAMRCSYIVLNSLVTGDDVVWECHKLGILYADQGKLVEAEQMYQRALQGYERAWGPEHTSTLDTVNSLGVLYKSQGKLVEAEQMYQRALQGKEKAWGPGHTSTLDTVNNLGLLYMNQGKLAEAEQMYQRALQGYERAWGPEHTSTLDTVNSLGVLYKSQGKLVEAEQMYQRALQGKERAWGPEHTSTLSTVNNLGLLYADQGKLVEAEQMYQRALQGMEKAWGPGHTSTLDTVNNLGLLYMNQGKLAEAEQMYQRALQGYEKALGAEHTSTLKTVNNLGLLYAYQGKLVEAEQMHQRALQGKERAWGPEHTLTLDTVNNLGVLYKNQGKLVEAEQMYQQALQGYERAWGPEHTSTLSTVNNLGLLYADQGKLVEAEQMYQRALQGMEKAWGLEHTSTLDTVNNLGNLYRNQGKLVEAEQMYQRALQGYEKAWGPEHTSTLGTVNNLGILYKNQGKLVEAEQMYQRALKGMEKAWGPEHASTLDAVNNLGLLYADQGKLVEAEQMYQRALQGKERAWGPEHTSTLDTINNLGNLYGDQGKLVEAEQMYQQALQGYEKAWGLEHTSTLDTVNNLGNLYRNQGKLVEAEQMYQRALQGYEKAWGLEHTSTLATVNNLGILYADQGKLVEAEQMYQRALQGKENALGPEHTSTLTTVNNLGNLYVDQGKLVEAEQMYQRALQGNEKACGPEHTSTLGTVSNLGLLYADQGKLVEAEQMHQRALRGYEKALGAEHTSTLKTVNNLGLLYKDQGKLAKAEQMYLRALRGYENALYPEHTLTLTTVEDLGHVLQMRCYAAVKHSTRIIVHLNVKQLVSLCLKFPRSRQRLLIYLVRAFAWIGDSENSIAAFEYQLAYSDKSIRTVAFTRGINFHGNHAPHSRHKADDDLLHGCETLELRYPKTWQSKLRHLSFETPHWQNGHVNPLQLPCSSPAYSNNKLCYLALDSPPKETLALCDSGPKNQAESGNNILKPVMYWSSFNSTSSFALGKSHLVAIAWKKVSSPTWLLWGFERRRPTAERRRLVRALHDAADALAGGAILLRERRPTARGSVSEEREGEVEEERFRAAGRVSPNPLRPLSIPISLSPPPTPIIPPRTPATYQPPPRAPPTMWPPSLPTKKTLSPPKLTKSTYLSKTNLSKTNLSKTNLSKTSPSQSPSPPKRNSSKLSPTKRSPPESQKGHAHTTSTSSAGSNTDLSRVWWRTPPSPPDSLLVGAGKEGASASTSGELSEGRGIGRRAARIKATVLGRDREEGEERIWSASVSLRGNGSASACKSGSLRNGRSAAVNRSVSLRDGGSATVSKSGSLMGNGNGSKVASKSVSLAGGNGSGVVTPAMPTKETVAEARKGRRGSTGEGGLRRGWSYRVNWRRNRRSRWRAKKVDVDAMPAGIVTGEREAGDKLWGRRAIWRRGQTEKEAEGEVRKKKKWGGITMLDASPAPVRLQSYEKVSGEGKGERKVSGQGEEEFEGEEWKEMEEEEDEWDEESLVRLSDWWIQMLERGKDPTWQELDMMTAFLQDLYEEDTPSFEMILTTRLHKLIEALIKAAGEQGLRYEGRRYRRIARKAQELKEKWMHDMGGRLYDMRSERREEMLKADKGRLGRVHMRAMENHTSRWVVEGHCVDKGVEFEPGMWWLNDACAERDGMLTDTRGNVSVSPQSIPVVTLEYGEEMPTDNPTITRYTHEGRIGNMMLFLLRTLGKRVQVLRKYTLKSRLAPSAGLRYDGFFNVVVYSLKRLSLEDDVFRVDIELERCMGQRPMDTVVGVPTPSMLDDWDIYLEIRDESVRKSIGEQGYRESIGKERDEERKRITWHGRRAEEDARRAEEEERRAEEDATRAEEDCAATRTIVPTTATIHQYSHFAL